MRTSKLTLVPAAVAAAALLLSGCGGSDDSESSTKTTSAAPTEEATTEATEAPASSGEVAVTADKITDDKLGHTIQAEAIVRSFPFPESMSAVEERGDTELVLVKVKATAAEKYYASVTGGDFRVGPKDAELPATQTTSTVETEMKAAGYEPLEDVKPGTSGEGWVAFAVRDASDPLFFTYKRLAYNGGDIPEKEFVVELTPKG
ncbi:MAG: hypothetical protein EON52_12100 [Actinomycetales bacterium]|nr:MAG: hypothetical protein EON52_12100 [Actinomycetales bacterium]